MKAKAVTPQDAIRYALSLPIATLVSGIDTMRVLRQNLAIAQGFRPMTDASTGGAAAARGGHGA